MELKEAASYFIDRISFEIEEPEERLEGAIRASMGAVPLTAKYCA